MKKRRLFKRKKSVKRLQCKKYGAVMDHNRFKHYEEMQRIKNSHDNWRRMTDWIYEPQH